MRFGILMLSASVFFLGGSGQHKTLGSGNDALMALIRVVKVQSDDALIVAGRVGTCGLTLGDLVRLPFAANLGEAAMFCAATPAAFAATLLPGCGGTPFGGLPAVGVGVPLPSVLRGHHQWQGQAGCCDAACDGWGCCLGCGDYF